MFKNLSLNIPCNSLSVKLGRSIHIYALAYIFYIYMYDQIHSSFIITYILAWPPQYMWSLIWRVKLLRVWTTIIPSWFMMILSTFHITPRRLLSKTFKNLHLCAIEKYMFVKVGMKSVRSIIQHRNRSAIICLIWWCMCLWNIQTC